ncbi:MAG: IMP cyclohydrolase [Oscillospiraceae bacterium]|nr:inosine monophosphate cyclohydrolase [Oscillospiraceae bacterium]MBR2180863.1 IMP cyclohydrolase [Oscillospiraceae bacterium]
MNIYEVNDIVKQVEGNSYVGRGIVIGKSADGKKACTAYFIMGRSANSRNRIFTEKNGEVFTEPFDVSKVEDPSLIIYAAIRKFENKLIVTNGDQTDTIYDFIKEGKGFREALNTREFEPDAPNFTPRISGMATFRDGDFSYEMSILKSIDEKGSACARYTYDYPSIAGLGHFIHTYVCDGNPIPTFQGEPERVIIPDDIDEFTNALWNALDAENKISLYVRYTDLASGKEENRMINKNK